MSLNRRLKISLDIKLYINIKRFLTLNQPCTRSQTKTPTKNQDCPKATANLAVVETAEHATMVVSYITRYASSPESSTINIGEFNVCYGGYKLKRRK